MIRTVLAFLVAITLAGCAAQPVDPNARVEPIGNFKMGHIGVVAPNVQKLLVSREATPEELVNVLEGALEARFRRFEGTRIYHFGISIEGYSLPPPIVPGKSYLAARLTVWDDATQTKLMEEPHLFAVPLVLESRLASSREKSMNALAVETAAVIEKWLRERQAEDGWFVDADGAASAATN